jgi:NADPH:quinone reductase-like Zn-dependent oxidoreductase
MSTPKTMRQLQSTVRKDGTLRLAVETVDVPTPKDDEVLVRVEASPINPSDLGVLLGGADVTEARNESDGSLVAPIPDVMMKAFAARVDQALPVGNEGAGTVVATGSSDAAKALEGRTVALLGGAMYGEYRAVKADQVLELEDGTTPEQGASCFVNPLTALGMTETMRRENHSALVHTAAASNLGQMLQKICLADGIPLVNIVRKDAQVELLKGIGATHVVNTSEDDYMAKMVDAFAETNATIAFDAIGGGDLGSRILTAMEQAAMRNATEFSIYGSNAFKQLYIYGGLDRGPTVLNRSFGFSWSVAGWLLPPFLSKIGPEAAEGLRRRVAKEITTTFASHYTDRIGLEQMLQADVLKQYARMATGEKYLVRPQD